MTLPVLLATVLLLTAGCNPFHNHEVRGERNRTTSHQMRDTTATHRQIEANGAEVDPSAESGDSPGGTIRTGRSLYEQYCSGCHGVNREGNPQTVPTLRDVGQRLSDREILVVVNEGRGVMPSFNHLSEAEKRSLLEYLSD